MSFLFRARWRSGSVVFPYGATPALAAEIISALGWVQCFWRIGLSLLSYNATPVSAWSPSQQLQNSELKTARYFFVLCQNQVPRKIQHSGSDCNLNSLLLLAVHGGQLSVNRKSCSFRLGANNLHKSRKGS